MRLRFNCDVLLKTIKQFLPYMCPSLFLDDLCALLNGIHSEFILQRSFASIQPVNIQAEINLRMCDLSSGMQYCIASQILHKKYGTPWVKPLKVGGMLIQ